MNNIRGVLNIHHMVSQLVKIPNRWPARFLIGQEIGTAPNLENHPYSMVIYRFHFMVFEFLEELVLSVLGFSINSANVQRINTLNAILVLFF